MNENERKTNLNVFHAKMSKKTAITYLDRKSAKRRCLKGSRLIPLEYHCHSTFTFRNIPCLDTSTSEAGKMQCSVNQDWREGENPNFTMIRIMHARDMRNHGQLDFRLRVSPAIIHYARGGMQLNLTIPLQFILHRERKIDRK